MAWTKHCVGIDIGSSAVKLCVIKATRSGMVLEQFGMAPLPADTVVDGSLMNSARVVDAIGELISAHRVKRKQVALSVSGHSVIIKKIAMPKMSRDELEEQMRWDAEQFIPFNIDDVYLDVQIVNPESAQVGQMDVVLVAAKKDYVNEYTSVVMEAGLDPLICDVDAFAVETMYENAYEGSSDATVALVNIGASKTNINVLVGGISNFTRDLTLGGNAFTEEIQRQMSVSREEAEAMKVGEHVGGEDSVVPQDVEQSLRAVAENVTSEIQRTIDFYAATSADPSPSRVMLCGGTASLPTLQRTLQERMGIPVEVADPFRSLDIDGHDEAYLRSIAPAASVSVGLALRFVGDQA